jgi:diacylglycerol O-acyltransferase / wax synthase
MERLSGLDASFLYNETPTLHMHTLKLAVLDPPEGTPFPARELVRDEIGRRLHLLPPFRRRVVEVPGRFHHPVWIEDPDLDLDRHIHLVHVPAPGGRAELDATVGELASFPLDRRRPLWDLYVLDGLEGGRIGVLVKIHHAAADGVAATQLLANVMSPDPGQADPPSPATPWVGEEIPSRTRLLVDALVDHLTQIRRLPALILNTVRRVRSAVVARREAAVSPPRPILDTPRSSIGGSLTAQRSFATADLPLDEVKIVKQAFGATVNDVVLAVVAGALRSWLLDRGEVPDRPLVAGIPVSSDRPDDVARLGGNRVSNLFTSLATDVEDPVERLRAIHAVTAVAKQVHNLLGAELMQEWVQYTPPAPYSWAMRAYGRLGAANWHRPPINLIVSNVPGPREPLFAAGARLAGIWSVGPILEGVGLNVTVWSYLDQLHVGILGCPDQAGDVSAVTARLGPALAELSARATNEGMTVPAVTVEH